MRSFRNRHRHRHLRALSTGSMAGLFPVFLAVFIGLWWDTHYTGYFGSKEYRESRFIDVSQRVSAWIDDYKNEHGRLPDSLQIEWLIKSEWEENVYYDEEDYVDVCFHYRCWSDENVYKLVSLGGWELFCLTLDSSWYVFRRWNVEGDSVVTVKLSATAAVSALR